MTAPSVSDKEIDEIAQKIMAEIEHKNSKELADSEELIRILHLTNIHHAKTLLEHVDEAPTHTERSVGRKAVIKALLMSTWLQRLYFIVRSLLMGILGSAVTFSFILVFGSINFALNIVVGVFSFVFSLAVSRLFDVQIVKVTKKIVDFLGHHNSLRSFLLNHF
jgi:hypothetical protein